MDRKPSRGSDSRFGLTRSERKEIDGDHLNYEMIDVESDESVLFQITDLEDYEGVHLHLHALREVDENGIESIRLAPKLFDTREAPVENAGLEDMPEEGQHQRFLKEFDRQVFFRKLGQTKGVDIMTGYSQSIEEGATVENVCCPGKDQLLMIDAKAGRGWDGRLSLRFGEPYLRARAAAKELLEAIENPPGESQ